MFLFGHIGITLIFFIFLKYLFKSFNGKYDYILIIIGSILPDIIDKPVGRILLVSSINNGRIFAHTLIFIILMFAIAYYIWKKNHVFGGFLIAGSSFCHLIEDKMWEIPKTFFWPLFGLNFPTNTGNYSNIFEYFTRMITLTYTPAMDYVFISEIIGFIICICLGLIYILYKKKTKAIIRD